MDGREANAIEPDREAQVRYVDALQDRAQGTVWLSSGCTSWYLDPKSRKLTIVWPDFAHAFQDRNGTFDPEGYDVRPAATRGELEHA